jgi:hypothetical protein
LPFTSVLPPEDFHPSPVSSCLAHLKAQISRWCCRLRFWLSGPGLWCSLLGPGLLVLGSAILTPALRFSSCTGRAHHKTHFPASSRRVASKIFHELLFGLEYRAGILFWVSVRVTCPTSICASNSRFPLSSPLLPPKVFAFPFVLPQDSFLDLLACVDFAAGS